MKRFVSFLYFTLFLFSCFAQRNKSKNAAPVYVDKQGVLRWTGTNKEANFFGVNYTTPFAYGYRSHKALGVDLEKAIDADVYHMARLGLDAFRVHVWDTEITDSLGNLKENEHLRLFDYLLHKLKQRNIKIFLTPLAFWGPGYPEPDIKTGSFSSIWNKQQVLVTETAIKAQENYLRQLLAHVNSYTKTTYGNDPDVIAIEINNEPHHSGTKQQAADYIGRMIKAVKSTGWTKPVFYNISESPRYADAVANADVDGVSFQWYPTGLVANRSLKGNYLPNVDRYAIPFDTIPAFRTKARMVYEFDAGDVLESYLYPAMARSFRTAGFQWATQFAYDPMATAYGNTEYQTHYLNLAYTPSKAISLLIAAKAFHQLPRLQRYGTYPADSVFDVFRVSYKNSLSEMNTDTAFYYSNTTQTKPLSAGKLKRIAGVGSSPVVEYGGTGAYFLDKLENGVWRLEVMPDAVHIRDPFEKASPKKEVTRIQWQTQPMQIWLPDLGDGFNISGVNKGNNAKATAEGNTFFVQPGTYLLTGKIASRNGRNSAFAPAEFFAPQPLSTEAFVVHSPHTEVSSGKSFFIAAKIVGADTADKISVELRNSSNKWRTVSLQKKTGYDYLAEVPADMVTPGVLNYRIIIQKANNEHYVFPGNHKGNPYAWDAYVNESWQTFVASEKTPLPLFNANTDRTALNVYNPDWRNNTVQYVTADKPGLLIWKATMNQPAAEQRMGWQLYIGDKLKGRAPELASFDKLIIRARTDNATPVRLKAALINANGQAFTGNVTLTHEWQDIEIPLQSLQPDSMLLLPRPYPGFQPLYFKAGVTGAFRWDDIEKLEITFGQASPQPLSLELESVELQKRK